MVRQHIRSGKLAEAQTERFTEGWIEDRHHVRLTGAGGECA
jgi:hypothetical protein